ncbi:MAG: DUF4956 domain-containing protein [Acidobacteria bacterium]|nr:DUF4956 domain-containing protein [Acidobacteriota bacterium]MBP8273803.1 DUF4956 domain-containing protein [Acidobacteriota bacterium]
MLDLLTAPFVGGPAIPPLVVALRLIVALLLGLVVSFIYRRTRAAEDIAPSFPATLVLLAVLIAMVTQVIGDNIARAFSLVGALSIVRFRTVVRDTQDTAFVIFAVIIGMAVGASDIAVALIGIAVVGVGAWMFKPHAAASSSTGDVGFVLTIRTTLGLDLQPILTVIDTFVQRRRLRAIGTAKQGLSIEASYTVQLRADRAADEFISTINRIDGLQSVELRRPTEPEE